MKFWSPYDEHMCSKHVEAWNKLILKQKFCVPTWLITEINILRCRVSKTSKRYMFRTVPLSIIRSFSLYTQQWHMPYSLQLSANLYDIYHRSVCSKKTPYGEQMNCPKHVDFYSKNKFEKLMYQFGFIIRIYHDARSPECQMQKIHLRCLV